MTGLPKSLTSGLGGAITLTMVHQIARRLTPNAPRMDVVGMRALSKGMRKAGKTPPKGDRLYTATLIGDLVANAAYYSLVGLGKNKGAWWRASVLGVGAGIGSIVLPPMLGLGTKPTQKTLATEIMSIAWYTTGAMATAALMRSLSSSDEK